MSVSQRVLNEDERPRVLIYTDPERQDQFKFIELQPGSFKYIGSINEVDLREWDAIVTDRPLASAVLARGEVEWWHRVVPLGLNVFYVQDTERELTNSNVLDGLVISEAQKLPVMTIRQRKGVPGKHATRVDGLPDGVQSLVQQVLVPLMDSRDKQFGHDPVLANAQTSDGTRYRPFLIGPSELTIAASYSRGPGSEVWILPSDISDFEPWYLLALSEWHERDASRFPGRPSWIAASTWMTQEEKALFDQLQSERSAFELVLAAHQRMVDAIQADLDTATAAAMRNQKHLLASQGDELQEAVKLALRSLGFHVRDMDLEWAPRERREDYRISDLDEPGWIAIGDATGVTKGVKGTKLTALGGFTTKYVLDEKPDTLPHQWLIVNHFVERDPEMRPALLRPDDLKLFASNLGLAIDSVALFLLAQHAEAFPGSAPAIREYLRTSTGQIGMKDAREWLIARGPEAS